MTMELETINKLYLELSQIATATPKRELDLHEFIKEANERLRSAYQIASRSGQATNWDAFLKQLEGTLSRQHSLMYPSANPPLNARPAWIDAAASHAAPPVAADIAEGREVQPLTDEELGILRGNGNPSKIRFAAANEIVQLRSELARLRAAVPPSVPPSVPVEVREAAKFIEDWNYPEDSPPRVLARFIAGLSGGRPPASVDAAPSRTGSRATSARPNQEPRDDSPECRAP